MPKPYTCVKKITFLLCFGFATYASTVGGCAAVTKVLTTFDEFNQSINRFIEKW